MRQFLVLLLILISAGCAPGEHAMHHARTTGMGIDTFGHTQLSEERADVSAAGLAHTERLLAILRSELPRYAKVDAALADGYKSEGEDVPVGALKHYLNYANLAANRKHLDPRRPTALLYRRTAGGFELAGVMFNAPIDSTMDELDRRIPLALGHWHSHRRLCQPKAGHGPLSTSERKEFGFSGSINTEDACARAGGVYMDNVFGWMVHVYPFEATLATQF